MKEKFTDIRISPERMKIIVVVNSILDEYRRQGYDLSLRQTFYQMISRDLLPDTWANQEGTKNTEKSYKKLGDIISDGRLAGLIDWAMIRDRGRECIQVPHWDSPADIVDAAAYSFRINKWEDQPCYVEVFVEKQALEGVLIPVCRELDVPFSANKGYSSSSAFYEAGQRLAAQGKQGKKLRVIYFGDFDPSGVDMTRDVEERLSLFARDTVEVNRVALNMPQVRQYNPPKNPAKISDPRAGDYISKYGDSSWELDALDPSTLAALVREAVLDNRDNTLWKHAVEKEQSLRDDLKKMAANYRAEEE